MTNPHETAARAEKAARIVAEILRRAREQNICCESADLIYFHDDLRLSDWHSIRLASNCKHPPSDETKRVVRRMLLARLSPDAILRVNGGGGGTRLAGEYEITADDRALMLDRESADAIATHEVAREQP